MHILIVPSEEFQPQNNHLAGIFQLHQAQMLLDSGAKVSVISVSLKYSIVMILKSILYKLISIESSVDINKKSINEQLLLLFDKLFRPHKFINREKVAGITIYRIEGFYYFPPSKHTDIFSWLRAGKVAFSRLTKELGMPDIIHAHNVSYAGVLANLLSFKSKKPFLITEHSSYIARNLESPLHKNKFTNSYTKAKKLISVSRFLALKIKDNYNVKRYIDIVPNVIDPFIQNYQFNRIFRRQNNFKFICIGSNIELKRHLDVVEAFSNLFENNKDVTLEIIGDGPLQNNYKIVVTEKKLLHKVSILNGLNRSELLNKIDESDCLIVSSEIETFGVVIIEALSRGVPVISSDCGGPADLINDKNGILYQIGNKVELEKAMSNILYKNFDHMEIRKDAINKYGSNTVLEKLVNIYISILQNEI